RRQLTARNRKRVGRNSTCDGDGGGIINPASSGRSGAVHDHWRGLIVTEVDGFVDTRVGQQSHWRRTSVAVDRCVATLQTGCLKVTGQASLARIDHHVVVSGAETFELVIPGRTGSEE